MMRTIIELYDIIKELPAESLEELRNETLQVFGSDHPLLDYLDYEIQQKKADNS